MNRVYNNIFTEDIMERVFITGRGLLTPLGDSVRANEEALRSGRSGITFNQAFADMKLESTVGGLAEQDPQTELIDRKTKRFCPPAGIMSVVAAAEAFKEANIALEDIPNMRMALVGGQAASNSRELYENASGYLSSNHRLRAVSPFTVPRVMPSSSVSWSSM